MRSIAEVIQQYGREALKQLPFGEDYRYINSLRFLTQQKEKMTQALSLLSPLTDIDLSQLTESYLQHAIAQSAFNDDMDSDTKADELDASLNQFRALCESFSVNTEKAAKIAELQMELKKIEDRLSEIHAHFAECFHNANKRTSLWQKIILKAIALKKQSRQHQKNSLPIFKKPANAIYQKPIYLKWARVFQAAINNVISLVSHISHPMPEAMHPVIALALLRHAHRKN